MSLDEFKRSLALAEPSERLGPALCALWWDAKGDWERAHRCVAERDDAESAWAHAYLHRSEGDSANAGYWYRRALRQPVSGPVAEEWAAMVSALLEASADR